MPTAQQLEQLINATPKKLNLIAETHFGERGIQPEGEFAAFGRAFDNLDDCIQLIYDQAVAIQALGTPGGGNLTEAPRLWDKLAQAAQAYNEFLLQHATREAGPSLLSSIKEAKLKELTNFAQLALATANVKPKRYKAYQPTLMDFFEVFHNPLEQGPAKLFHAGVKAWDNAGAMIGERYKLTSDPSILTKFGEECTVTVIEGAAIFGNKHVEDAQLTDGEQAGEGQTIILPIHGPKDNRPEAEKFSVLALAKEIFPDNPQRHLEWSKDGRLAVKWYGDAEKKKWLGALKKRNQDYIKWKNSPKPMDANITIPKAGENAAHGRSGAPFAPPNRTPPETQTPAATADRPSSPTP